MNGWWDRPIGQVEMSTTEFFAVWTLALLASVLMALKPWSQRALIRRNLGDSDLPPNVYDPGMMWLVPLLFLPVPAYPLLRGDAGSPLTFTYDWLPTGAAVGLLIFAQWYNRRAILSLMKPPGGSMR